MVQSDGNSGKSLLFEIINRAMGSYGITADSDLITDTTYKSNNAEQVARLKGKRYVFIDELDENSYLKEKLVKDLTSGIGKMVGRYLYKNTIEFLFRGKINITTNYEVKIKGIDKGVWRRIILLKTSLDVTGRENKHLMDELMDELPQICGWLYEGFKLYQKEGLDIPDSIKKDVDEYRQENDIVAQWINEYCELKPSYFERANVLYDNFRAFCLRRDLRTNQTSFGRNLGKKYKKYNSGEGIVYIGLRLRKNATDLSKKVNYENTKVSEDI